MTDMPGIRGLSNRRSSRLLVILTAAVALGIGAAGFFFRALEVEPMQELSAGQAESVGRYIGVVFDDNERSWARWFDKQGLEPLKRPEQILYSNVQPSPCAGAVPASGPFYCPLDNTAGFDLVFMSGLRGELEERGEMGTALVVARVYARHVQDSLLSGRNSSEENRANMLQADCLAGVWAGQAQGRLGHVPDGFYGEVLGEAQSMSGEEARSPFSPALNMFARAQDASRDDAFVLGRKTQDPVSCLNLR
ncbi:neutral zinc metallopeptidase [Amaricoccus tamworthensis]|uniref:neutral zinc metallopeptidase n=1 Tax=Amaricoccus tamworthensis TaxID=57002 RepID=UPI003C7BBE88